jgi:hypothetical protein
MFARKSESVTDSLCIIAFSSLSWGLKFSVVIKLYWICKQNNVVHMTDESNFSWTFNGQYINDDDN